MVRGPVQSGQSELPARHGRVSPDDEPGCGGFDSDAPRPPLRLLLVSYEFPPIGGGGASALQAILKQLAQRPDLDVLLVTSSPDSELHSERIGERIRIHRLPVGKRDLYYWRRVEVLRFLRRATRYVRRELRQKNWDLSIGFFGFPSGYVSWRFAQQLPYLIFLRGSDVPGFNPRFGLDYVALRPLFRRIWRGASGVVANSRRLARLAADTCPELDYEMLPNGVDTEVFQPRPKREAGGPVRLIVAARLIRRKAVHDLLEVLYQLGEGVSPWELDIYGDGPERHRLQTLTSRLQLADRVHFHGHIDRADMPGALARGDLFVMPSLWEGMSNAVLEAMACGLPVVVTRTGGADELVEDNGFIIDPGDTDGLAAALGKLIDNREALPEMGRRSRLRAERMSWEQVADGFLGLCHRAIGR